MNWKGLGRNSSFHGRDNIIPVLSWRKCVNLQNISFRIFGFPVKTGSGHPRDAFVERYRYINRHSMYPVSTILLVVGNSPCNCDVITRILINFRLRIAGLKDCGSVSYYTRVRRSKIYFVI